MKAIVLQIRQPGGTNSEIELQPGLNNLTPVPGEQYRLVNVAEDASADDWAPLIWRDGDDLVVESSQVDETLVLTGYFDICTQAGDCLLEVAPMGSAPTTIDVTIAQPKTLPDGRSLLMDYSTVADESETSALAYAGGALGALGTLFLLSDALGGEFVEPSTDTTDTTDDIESTTATVPATIAGVDPVTVNGSGIDKVEIEGDDQLIVGTEAGPDDRLEITLTMDKTLDDTLDVSLFWHDQEAKLYTQLTEMQFTVETDALGSEIRLFVDVYERQNGTTIETDNDTTELSITVSTGTGLDDDLEESSVDIPLELALVEATTTSTSSAALSPDPQLMSSDFSLAGSTLSLLPLTATPLI